jgi:hypothetical protein
MFISYGSCSDGGFGGLDELDPINVAGIASSPINKHNSSTHNVPEDFITESTEIWALELNGLAESQNKLVDLESD